MAKFLEVLTIVFQTLSTLGQSKLKEVENEQDKFFPSSEAVLPILIQVPVKHWAQVVTLAATKHIPCNNPKIEMNRVLNGWVIGGPYNYDSASNLVKPTGTRPGSEAQVDNFPTPSIYSTGIQQCISSTI